MSVIAHHRWTTVGRRGNIVVGTQMVRRPCSPQGIRRVLAVPYLRATPSGTSSQVGCCRSGLWTGGQGFFLSNTQKILSVPRKAVGDFFDQIQRQLLKKKCFNSNTEWKKFKANLQWGIKLIWMRCVNSLTSLLFRDGVLLEEDDPLRLGGLSTLILSPLVLPFSLISPGLPRDTCSPFVCGEEAS